MIVRLLGRSLLFRAAAVTAAASLVMLITPSGPIQLAGLLTLLTCAMLVSHRATPFEASIPVDARRIFLARISVGLALMCLPLLAWILSAQLRGVSIDPEAVFFDLPQEVRLLALPIAALIVILPHATRPGVLPPPGRGSFAPAAWAVLAVGSPAAISVLSVGTATVLLTAAAVATLGWTWHRMPHSYQLAPAGAPRAWRTVRAAPAATPGTAAVQWWRPVLRTIIPLRLLFSIAMIGFFAAIGDMWLLYLIILGGPEMVGMARERLQWMHTLPLSRTAVLCANLAPAALSLLAVLLGGAVIGPALLPWTEALHEGRPHEYTHDEIFDRRTMVPLAFWRIAPRGEAQVVRAPWGETTTTDRISLPGLTLYNPYSATTESSAELIEWQFQRASAAVHGRSFTTAEYEAVSFVPPRRVTRSASVYLLGGSLVLTFVLMIAWLIEVLNWHALTARPVLRYAIGTFTVAIVVGVALVEFHGMFGHRTQILVPLGAALAMRAAAALPNIGVVAVVAALPVVAAYSLLHWQIGRSDLAAATRKG